MGSFEVLNEKLNFCSRCLRYEVVAIGDWTNSISNSQSVEIKFILMSHFIKNGTRIKI